MSPRVAVRPQWFVVVGVFAWLCPLAAAAEPTTRPAAGPASQPAPLDPAVERILDRLEKKTVRDIEADLVYTKTDPILEDEQKFTGILRFVSQSGSRPQDKLNPRFFIRFDQVVHEGIVQKKKEWHVFDGQWYIEARERTRTIIKRQIVRPGEKVEAFRIGKGPFPLPFGQKKAEILRHFSVELIPPSPKDPNSTKNTDHLECTPLPGTEMSRQYGKVHFYIDRKLDLPICVRTVEKEEGNEISAVFSNIRLNQKLDPGKLELPPLDYETREEPLPPATPPSRPGASK